MDSIQNIQLPRSKEKIGYFHEGVCQGGVIEKASRTYDPTTAKEIFYKS